MKTPSALRSEEGENSNNMKKIISRSNLIYQYLRFRERHLVAFQDLIYVHLFGLDAILHTGHGHHHLVQIIVTILTVGRGEALQASDPGEFHYLTNVALRVVPITGRCPAFDDSPHAEWFLLLRKLIVVRLQDLPACAIAIGFAHVADKILVFLSSFNT